MFDVIISITNLINLYKVHSVANDIFKSVNEAVAANKKDLKRVNTAKDSVGATRLTLLV